MKEQVGYQTVSDILRIKLETLHKKKNTKTKTPLIQDTLFFPKTLGFQSQAKSKKLCRFMHDQ